MSLSMSRKWFVDKVGAVTNLFITHWGGKRWKEGSNRRGMSKINTSFKGKY